MIVMNSTSGYERIEYHGYIKSFFLKIKLHEGDVQKIRPRKSNQLTVGLSYELI